MRDETNEPGPRLSAVIPLRNRAGLRLENCLRSLRWQEGLEEPVEIVLSDFGSDDTHAREIAALAERYGARVTREVTDAVWNRSRALNLGIQAARGAICWATDADMIFQPNFAATVLAEHGRRPGECMVLCRCHDLPEEVPDDRLWSVEDFEPLQRRARIRSAMGTGACQAAPRAFFERVRGYDEEYVFWGAEDVDMSGRARIAGLEIVWISARTAMLHQWHRTTKHDRKWLWRRNRRRFRKTGHVVVKNPDGWGSWT